MSPDLPDQIQIQSYVPNLFVVRIDMPLNYLATIGPPIYVCCPALAMRDS